MNIDIEALKQAAQAATPGPWECGDGKMNGNALIVYGEDFAGAAICEMRSPLNFTPRDRRVANSTYIAAANPAVVLELIARLERAEAGSAAGTSSSTPLHTRRRHER